MIFNSENKGCSCYRIFTSSESWGYADETRFYYRALPEHIYIFNNEKAKGTKTLKDQLTLLCCAGMTGEKKKLLEIGKSKKPSVFQSSEEFTHWM